MKHLTISFGTGLAIHMFTQTLPSHLLASYMPCSHVDGSLSPALHGMLFCTTTYSAEPYVTLFFLTTCTLSLALKQRHLEASRYLLFSVHRSAQTKSCSAAPLHQTGSCHQILAPESERSASTAHFVSASQKRRSEAYRT